MSYDDPGKIIDSDQPAMTELLHRAIGIPSVSGDERIFTEFIAQWAKSRGWEVDLWESNEDEIGQIAPLPPRFIPLTGRPTMVARLPGDPSRRSLIFNAHSDVVPAPHSDQWRHAPWSGTIEEGRIYGRGACDVKGPLISALWAMSALAKNWHDRGDLLLELIPGEEDCVGLGTLTSVARGYKSDGAIVLEPTEGMPRCASRGGYRFEIVCHGKAVHGTVKWLGVDAIGQLKILNLLERLESKWNDRAADSLFADYPTMRPITVDCLSGGQWQGMVCDRAICAGYLELLPGDDLTEWERRLEEALRVEVPQVEVRTLEHYHGHVTAVTDVMCRTAESVLQDNGQSVHWRGFNSGCEAGLRWRLLGTPTLVWGPGSLVQAHAVDEFVELKAVRDAAVMMAQFADRWCSIAR